jgi:ERF superfamily
MTRAPKQAVIPQGSPLNAPAVDAATAMMQIIERAVLNPAFDVEKLKSLLDMQERVMARTAKAAYVEALRNVKSSLPIIAQNGLIVVKAKGTEKVLQETPYTKYEDIDHAVTPILDAHGMVLSFRTGTSPDGRLVVTGVLSHREGHEETTTLVLPYDSSGSKNGVQAVGSSLSYGKRYAATALLNLVSAGEDDDGELGGKLPSAKKTEMGERCADLANEIKGLESIGATVAWANARAAEISTFPKNWQAMLRDDLIAQKALIREQEAREGGFQATDTADLGDDDFPGDRSATDIVREQLRESVAALTLDD